MTKTKAYKLGMEAFKRGDSCDPYADKSLSSGLRYADDPKLFGACMILWRSGWNSEGNIDFDKKLKDIKSTSFCVDRTLSAIAHNNGFSNADKMCLHVGISRATMGKWLCSKDKKERKLKPLFGRLGLSLTRPNNLPRAESRSQQSIFEG